MFNKQYLSNELGLSCIEDYIMYLMNSREINWKPALFKSFVNLKKIIYEMNVNRCEYSNIHFIPRIQNVLKDENVITLKNMSFTQVVSLDNESVFMIQVKPDIMKNKYNTVTLRDDHYWLVSKQSNNEYEYMNDRPYASEKLNLQELIEVNDSDTIVFISILNDKLRNINEKITEFFKSLNLIDTQIDYIGDLDVEKLRDSIGIYRITIRRAEAFLQACGQYIDLSQYYQAMDKIYLKLEYMKIRKKVNSDELNICYRDMLEMQNNIISQIKNKLKG